MSIFSKKKPPPDDSFQKTHAPAFVGRKPSDKALLDAISPYQNELLLRGKIGMEPGVVKKDSVKPDTKDDKSDTMNQEPETEYAQIMKININQKFNEESME